MEATAPRSTVHSYPRIESAGPSPLLSRPRATTWLQTVGSVWGLITILVLGFSLMGQLGAERDWLGRGLVFLLLGGQCSLAALQLSRWRKASHV
jgi:hypothetical protein